jgi:hypothetical protein
MRLNACPKCRGAVALERDQYGPYEHCLRCGWYRDLDQAPSLSKTADVKSENVHAPDDGCSVAQSCFQCPLADCQYDAPPARAAYLRDQELLAVFRQHEHLGRTAAAELAAQAMKTTSRSVFRALSRDRRAA